METTQGITAMIPVTTIAGIGEEHVFFLVVTDPLAATFGPDQFPGFSAQTASRFSRVGRRLARSLWLIHAFFAC
jgi:hypothetical protein